MNAGHQPVLLEEVVRFLAPVSGGVYVDGNLGLGGHTERILEESGPDGRVIGFDLDAAALDQARQRLARFGDRVRFVHRNFSSLKETLMECGVARIDGLVLDLGVSSWQLAAPGRGFSFQRDEPLDMRMDTRQERTAARLVNTLSEGELADLFYYYGEERQARRIARRIVETRARAPLRTTGALAKLVADAVPPRFHPRRIHVATKVFQALRIAVNQELQSLELILGDAPPLLKPSGRFCVISFHSLEDRLVKRAFASQPLLRPLTRKPVVPGEVERRANPRSRSARLRVAERLEGES